MAITDVVTFPFAVNRLMRLKTARDVPTAEVARRMKVPLAEVEMIESGGAPVTTDALERYARAVGAHVFVAIINIDLPEDTVDVLRRLRADALRDGPDSPAWHRFGAYVVALNEAQWPLATIGHALKISKQAIHKWRQGNYQASDVPPVPCLPADTSILSADILSAPRPERPRPTPCEIRQLTALQADAVQLRGNHPADHRFRVASEELSLLIYELRLRQVPVDDIAAIMGVTRVAVHSRLRRHGYTEPNAVTSRHRYQGAGASVKLHG